MASRDQSALSHFHAPTRQWFERSFAAPTTAQAKGWPAIARGGHALVLAPTGSGKTLAAFLHCLDRLMFSPRPDRDRRCRVLYVSPLKALAVDVERNLRAPLAGISATAAALGEPFTTPEVAIRTGDTPQRERARFSRDPADILITTPESLYLMLTSNVREVLRSVDTVIVDEIHALVPNKRGAHLAVSLERLAVLTGAPIQRIGLSATVRPLDEVSRFLGGTAPVEVVDAGSRKALELQIEVPVEDMARLGQPTDEIPSGSAAQLAPRTSIWSAIHPRLVELIRQHTSTLIFVNARRGAERLAGALNELAGETLVQAHHGSIARAQRMEIEDNLKAGKVRGLVATSSLELGIDMGAIDLVVQIEAPPSVANGLQRVGRGGHSVGQPSRGILFPKYRGDLVACAALARAMREGQVESSRYPRNPLDVLAQQLVAMCALEPWKVDALFETVRRAAPFSTLTRPIFEGLLDMLSGRHISEELADLKPRLTWDRIEGTITAREGARRVAIANAGTIPDRGLYGVFLSGSDGKHARVGELDEEMVFESRVGEVFVLGASSWRIEEITHDRVMVSPAPGVPGKMPFWHGDSAARPLEVGQRIGKLVRDLRAMPRQAALEWLSHQHALEPQAAENLLRYLDDQHAATTAIPDDRTIVIERFRDEMGDWRICVLSPLGAQVHAPWSMAVAAKLREALGVEAESLWTNEGFAFRLPESDAPPDGALFVPDPDEIERMVMDALGGTALFAAKFREIAGRALLLPRRRPGQRAPLWQQRKRASDLLAVASRYPSFPMLLESYRECLRDVFDMPALQATLRAVSKRQIRVHTVDTETPSPFASALLFGFVANYIYEGDAPLAERRAQALAIDQAQLRELLGEAELRELLDFDAMQALEAELQHLEPKRHAKSADALHDLLLRIGDLSESEIEARSSGPWTSWVRELERARRSLAVRIGGERRFIAVEDAARYRDALGVPLPPGVPESLLQPLPEPLRDLLLRFARTHAPFTFDDAATRLGIGRAQVEPALQHLVRDGRLLEGAFRPGGGEVELCDPEVLRELRRRSLARLRAQVAPVEPRTFGRFLTAWQGVVRRRKGLDAVLDVVEQLQGQALPASLLETEILPARIEGYLPGDLDALASAGEITWVGVEPLGERDGRVALFLAERLADLRPPQALSRAAELDEKEQAIVEHLRTTGASFFSAIHAALGGYEAANVDALWSLVWKGLITNDTFRALRAYTEPSARVAKRERISARGFRSRRTAPPSAEGRWSLVPSQSANTETTAWVASLGQQLLARYGVVTREVAQSEGIPGGFSALYAVFKAMEESGRIRRGYFVSGVGAAQFALPPVLDQLRALRDAPDQPEALLLAATDPANPYGALLPWPQVEARAMQRAVGAHVVLVNGALTAFASRGAKQLWMFLPENEPDRSAFARAAGQKIFELAARMRGRREGLLIEQIDGRPAQEHAAAPFFTELGFTATAHGLQLRRLAALPRPAVPRHA